MCPKLYRPMRFVSGIKFPGQHGSRFVSTYIEFMFGLLGLGSRQKVQFHSQRITGYGVLQQGVSYSGSPIRL